MGEFKILVEVTEQRDFESYVSRNALVVFSAPAWCKPCLALKRQLDVLATRIDTPIVYVDIDKAEEIRNQYTIMSVPKVYVFNEGKPVKEISGRAVITIEKELASE